MKDSLDRVATVIFQKGTDKFLIGHAPNFPSGPNTWDIVGKGHIAEEADPADTCIREVKEESGIEIKKEDLVLIDCVSYQKGKMYIYATVGNFEENEIICESFFDWYGKKLPEFSIFQWISLENYKDNLYKSLVKTFDKYKVIDSLKNFLETKKE